MSWFANALARTYGRRAFVNAWGEGLVDRSLTTLWYPVSWDEVTDDELVFLLPSLSRWRPQRGGIDGCERSGPTPYLTRTLSARARSAARLIASRSNRRGSAAAREILDCLNCYLTSLTACQLSVLENDFVRLHSASGRTQKGDSSGSLTAELTALAYLDRMLSDALGGAPSQRQVSPVVDWPLSLADAVAASVNARLNAAYVYPEFACAHELLSLSAVLGHLAQGRAICLPPSLAGALVDVLTSKSKDDASAAALRTFANMAGGADYLTTIARSISATDSARRIFPYHSARAQEPEAWNARLVQRIAIEEFRSTSRV